jgi:predicted AlkP superfamily phosphohydrolase/phosphomutase
MKRAEKGNAPLLVFGFDGGDPDLLLRWGHDGTLPALGSILRRGSWARLAGPEMISEHGMWVSITSGVSRAQHGYYYFRQLVPGTYDLAPMRGRKLGVKPFWVDYPDKRVAVVDVPDIAAPEPQPGVQLSEWATHYPYFSPSAHPFDFLIRIREDIGEPMIIHEEPESTYDRDREIYARLMQRAAKKKRLCLELIESDRFDLIFVVFGECHTGAHQLWKYHRERNSPNAQCDLSHGVRNIYQAIDSALAAIMERLPSEAPVFVLSSVGMKNQWPAFGLNEAFCRQLGYQVAPEASASFQPLDLVRRSLPQGVRDQLSRFLSRDTQEKLISDKFRSSTDWSRTTAFSIPAYYTGQFRVNLRGREPEGTINPGAEYNELLDRMEADLAALIDPCTQKPAVKAVRRTDALFGGGPPEVLPDLFAEWADATHFVDRVVHPAAELRQLPCDFHRDTDHSQFGMVAAAGPAIAEHGDLGVVSPLDLVPTFLAHLGNPVPERLVGQVIPKMSSEFNLQPVDARK